MDTDSFLGSSCDLELGELENWACPCSSPSSCPGDCGEAWLEATKSSLPSAVDALLSGSGPNYTSVLKLSDVSVALQAFSTKFSSPSSLSAAMVMRPSHAAIGTTCHVFRSPSVTTATNHRSLRLKRTFLSCEDKDVPHATAPRSCSTCLSASPSAFIPSSNFKKMRTTIHGQESDGPSTLCKEGRLSQREVHIYSERQRRKSMRESFSILQALIPKLNLKRVDRITVLTEVIKYIHKLRGALEGLQRRKADMMELLGISEEELFIFGSLPRGGGCCGSAEVQVAVRLCGNVVFITLSMPRQRGVWSVLLMVLQRFEVDVCNATLATSRDSTFHCIEGKISNDCVINEANLQEKLESIIVKHLERTPKHEL